MKLNKIDHGNNLYNILLTLSRNIFFYSNIRLPDTFETRIYLMFIHFSIILIVFKKKSRKYDQKSYDSLFFNVENNLRELGFGDVTVNKKMKEFNKILYDILLKIELKDEKQKENIEINHKLVSRYFSELNDPKNEEYKSFESYFSNFFNFCFEIPIDNMLIETINSKN